MAYPHGRLTTRWHRWALRADGETGHGTGSITSRPRPRRARERREKEEQIAALRHRINVLERTNHAAITLLTQANGRKPR